METLDTHIEVDEVRLAVRRLRCPDPRADRRPALVFLHEGLGCIEQWGDFPAALCARLGTHGLVYDRQGYGRSDPFAADRAMDYHYSEALEMLPAVLDGYGLKAPVLIGHSDGGTIALLLAAHRPGRVGAVVTEAAHVIVEPETVAGIRQALRYYEHGDLREQLARYHGDKTDAMFHAWADPWLDPQYADWDCVGDLAGVNCPVLAIQGEQDHYGTVRQLELIQEHTGGETTVAMIPDCGHMPHREQREQMLEMMAAFVEQFSPQELCA